MTLPKNDPEVREEVAREVGDDVQGETLGEDVAKTRFFVTKCRFTRRTATLRSEHRPILPFLHCPESPMSSRRLVLVALASLVLGACASSTTAPRQDDTSTAPILKAVTSGSYDVVPDDSAKKAVTSGSY